MMTHTLQIIRTALKADSSIAATERARLLAAMRGGGEQVLKPARVVETRLIRRAEVARRLGCSLRLVDRLAKDGALVKRKLPGRKRAAGILESDVLALIAQETTLACCA
jgi:hypothetical protein